MTKTVTRYYVNDCPLGDRCRTSQAWTKLKKCQSFKSETETRQWLFQHLNRSGLHAEEVNEKWEEGDEDYVQRLVDEAIVETEVVQFEPWMDTGDKDQASLAAKAKADSGRGKRRRTEYVPGSGSSDPLVLTPADGTSTAVAVVQEAMAYVPISKLKKLLDCAERAKGAARHAVAIAAGAKESFENEARIFEDVCRDVAREVDRATLLSEMHG